MEFDYSYSFTAKAENDLEGILRYIRDDLLNPSAATDFGRKLFESIDNVRNFPQSGMLVENDFLADKKIRRVIIENYVMYYVTDDEKRKIYIVRIVYGKRNLEEIYRTIKG